MAIPMDISQGAFILNKHLFTGWSDAEDALGMPGDIELSIEKVGADGLAVGQGTGNKGGEVTLKLMPNSPSVAFMSNLIKRQQQGIPIVYNGSWTHGVSGEKVYLKGGFLKRGPKGTIMGKGNVGEKVYVFYFSVIDETPETLLLGAVAGLVSSLI